MLYVRHSETYLKHLMHKVITLPIFHMKIIQRDSQNKLINEEVTIMVDGKMYKVGVVEYTDDWSPFHPATFNKAEKESDEDMNDIEEEDYEDGVSETWMMEDNNDAEEREIRLESSPKNVSLYEIRPNIW